LNSTVDELFDDDKGRGSLFVVEVEDDPMIVWCQQETWHRDIGEDLESFRRRTRNAASKYVTPGCVLMLIEGRLPPAPSNYLAPIYQ
jgi:hypothetical protein